MLHYASRLNSGVRPLLEISVNQYTCRLSGVRSLLKITVLFLFAAMAMSGCATVGDDHIDDATLTQKLQHTWAGVPDDIEIDGETTYLPEGVWNMLGHFKHEGKIYTVLASGKWHVKDGYLHYSVTHSNLPSMVPDGFASADKIVRVTDSEFIYVSPADGRMTTEHRVR